VQTPPGVIGLLGLGGIIGAPGILSALSPHYALI
jgi:K+ transporter